MPKIPTYTSQVSLPAPRTPWWLMRPQTAAAPYRELGKLGSTIAAFSERMLQVRRVTELQNAKTGALKELIDFETGLFERQDFDSFETDYNDTVRDIKERYREEISDRVVYQAFKNDFDRQSLRSLVSVRNLANKKRIDFGRASYLNNMTTLSALYPDADERTRENIFGKAEIFTSQAVRVGYLTAEQGIASLQQFHEQTEIADAMQQIRTDPKAFNPDDYPHINLKSKIILNDDAVRRIESDREESIRLETKAEKAQEKALKKRQEQAAREMWPRLETDLIVSEVDEGIQNGTLSLSEGKALRNALKTERTESDPEDLLALNEDVRDGAPGIKERILTALTIAPAHKNALLQKLYSLEDEKKKHDYIRATNTIKAFIVTEYGPLGQFVKADEIQTYNFAVNELDLRLGRNEDIWQATTEILKNRDIMKPLPPILSYGSIEVIEEAEKLLVEAYMKQEIDKKSYNLEARKIEAYQNELNIYNNRLSILQQLSRQ